MPAIWRIASAIFGIAWGHLGNYLNTAACGQLDEVSVVIVGDASC